MVIKIISMHRQRKEVVMLADGNVMAGRSGTGKVGES
jgi:hypothetical protein